MRWVAHITILICLLSAGLEDPPTQAQQPAPKQAASQQAAPKQKSQTKPDPVSPKVPVGQISLAGSQKVAAKLLDTTMSVYVTTAITSQTRDGKKYTRQAITTASGISLGNGLIVTYVNMTDASRVRVTLPDNGESLAAQVRVVDQYSGLSLLQVKDTKLPRIALAGELPAVGAPVYTAAGSGIAKPIVSFGIVAGTDRNLGAFLPPLMQCDLRATGSSSGAAVAGRDGKLAGVVVSVETPNRRSGWTYAVPVRYVRRLLDNQPKKDTDGMVLLRRRRATLGLVLRTVGDDKEIAVQVVRVTDKGPAAQAGIKVGDVVSEVEGIKIRSVYHASSMALRKEPGDKMAFVVLRDDASHNVNITLGGAGNFPFAMSSNQANLGSGTTWLLPYGSRGVQIYQANVRPAGQGGTTAKPATGTTKPKATPSSRESELLRKQLQGWSLVIQRMQKELQKRNELIRALEAKVKRLEDKNPAGKAEPAEK